MKQKITLALAALMCAFGVVRAQVPFTQEDGNYLISTAEDLVKLSQMSNDVADVSLVQNASFRLRQDIDMSSVENFTPLFYTSSNGQSYKGIFDGQGHTVSNVTITTNESNSTRPLHTCDFRFFTSSRSNVTGVPDDSTFSFSSFFASFFSCGFSFAPPSLASSGSSMRVKLSTFFSSKT